MNKWTQQQLVAMIEEDALFTGDFKLASGKQSGFYIDFSKISLTSECTTLLGETIAAAVDPETYDAVGGPVLGAAPIVSSVLAHVPQKRGFLVRRTLKSHGKRDERIEGPIKHGDRVLIVEDVTTSGQSVLWAARTVEKLFKVDVVRILTVVDREDGAVELFEKEKIPFQSLVTVEDLLI